MRFDDTLFCSDNYSYLFNKQNIINIIDGTYKDNILNIDKNTFFNINTCSNNTINIEINNSSLIPLNIIYLGRSENTDSFNLSIKVNDNVNSNVFLYFIDQNKSNIWGKINFNLGSNVNIKTRILYINKYSSNYKIDVINHNVKSFINSDLIVKGILYKNANVDFNMKIVTDRFLKSIKSSELHKVLKLSSESIISSVPAIICETPDAEIHHGFASSGFDEKQISFLNSRGINSEESKKLLINAFIHSIEFI